MSQYRKKTTVPNGIIYIFIGTTAELIKLIPVILELKNRNISYKIITSGQNTINLKEFSHILQDENVYKAIQNKNPQSSILYFILWIIRAQLESLLLFFKERNSTKGKSRYILVHGDTVSAFIGALSGKICGYKVLHIESGLRSFNVLQPFPEELTRILISFLTSVNFCPNDWAVNNLRNRRSVKINTTQNTLIESLAIALKIKEQNQIHKKLSKVKYCVLVLHRQEHMFKKELIKRLLETSLQNIDKDIKCVIVMHHITERFMQDNEIKSLVEKHQDKIIKVPRSSYFQFMSLLQDAEFIITDGGSNQEESYYLGKPCLILRDVTERIEGLGKNAILSHYDGTVIQDFLHHYKSYVYPKVKDTKSPSQIIVDYIYQLL